MSDLKKIAPQLFSNRCFDWDLSQQSAVPFKLLDKKVVVQDYFMPKLDVTFSGAMASTTLAAGAAINSRHEASVKLSAVIPPSGKHWLAVNPLFSSSQTGAVGHIMSTVIGEGNFYYLTSVTSQNYDGLVDGEWTDIDPLYDPLNGQYILEIDVDLNELYVTTANGRFAVSLYPGSVLAGNRISFVFQLYVADTITADHDYSMEAHVDTSRLGALSVSAGFDPLTDFLADTPPGITKGDVLIVTEPGRHDDTHYITGDIFLVTNDQPTTISELNVFREPENKTVDTVIYARVPEDFPKMHQAIRYLMQFNYMNGARGICVIKDGHTLDKYDFLNEGNFSEPYYMEANNLANIFIEAGDIFSGGGVYVDRTDTGTAAYDSLFNFTYEFGGVAGTFTVSDELGSGAPPLNINGSGKVNELGYPAAALKFVGFTGSMNINPTGPMNCNLDIGDSPALTFVQLKRLGKDSQSDKFVLAGPGATLYNSALQVILKSDTNIGVHAYDSDVTLIKYNDGVTTSDPLVSVQTTGDCNIDISNSLKLQKNTGVPAIRHNSGRAYINIESAEWHDATVGNRSFIHCQSGELRVRVFSLATFLNTTSSVSSFIAVDNFSNYPSDVTLSFYTANLSSISDVDHLAVLGVNGTTPFAVNTISTTAGSLGNVVRSNIASL